MAAATTVYALDQPRLRIVFRSSSQADTCLFLVQSHVSEHTELHYLLECTTGYGEAQRMIQFKEKSRSQQQVRISLLTYPILMAADILLSVPGRCS